MIDIQKFFDGVRDDPFNGHLSPTQVSGMQELLAAWDEASYPNPWYVAVNLANVFHETGGHMIPVREGFARSDVEARAMVERKRRKYAVEIGGHVYYGRGRIQNTWLENYQALSKRFGVDLVSNPGLLITDTALDARITVIGHVEGIWTKGKYTLGKFLDDMPRDVKVLLSHIDYKPRRVAETNLIQSRRCVNALDKADVIAASAKKFYIDLVRAGYE